MYQIRAILAYKRPTWNAESEGDSTYFEVLQALIELCTIYTSNTSSLFLSMPDALAICVGRLGQSVSVMNVTKVVSLTQILWS
jgi:hypothetical protein